MTMPVRSVFGWSIFLLSVCRWPSLPYRPIKSAHILLRYHSDGNLLLIRQLCKASCLASHLLVLHITLLSIGQCCLPLVYGPPYVHAAFIVPCSRVRPLVDIQNVMYRVLNHRCCAGVPTIPPAGGSCCDFSYSTRLMATLTSRHLNCI